MSEEEDLRRFYTALMEVMFSRSTAATNVIINKVRPHAHPQVDRGREGRRGIDRICSASESLWMGVPLMGHIHAHPAYLLFACTE